MEGVHGGETRGEVEVWKRERERMRENEREREREEDRDRVCVRACVCTRDKERRRKRGRETERACVCMRVRERGGATYRSDVWVVSRVVFKEAAFHDEGRSTIHLPQLFQRTFHLRKNVESSLRMPLNDLQFWRI